jgi:predicted nucleic acid-binding protein
MKMGRNCPIRSRPLLFARRPCRSPLPRKALRFGDPCGSHHPSQSVTRLGTILPVSARSARSREIEPHVRLYVVLEDALTPDVNGTEIGRGGRIRRRRRAVLRSAASILISRLSGVEVQSAFAGKVRSGVILAGDPAGLRRRFLVDIVNGVFRVVAVTSSHYDQAGELADRHGASPGLRTLDSLQLAVALSLHRGGAIETLVTADKVLCKVAAVEGIPVTNPESAALPGPAS